MDFRLKVLCPVESILSTLLASNVTLHQLNYRKSTIFKEEIQSTRISQEQKKKNNKKKITVSKHLPRKECPNYFFEYFLLLDPHIGLLKIL